MVTPPLLPPSILLGEGCTVSYGKHLAGLLSRSLVLMETFSLPLNLDLLAFLAPLHLLCQSAFRTINLTFPSLIAWSPDIHLHASTH